MDERQFDKESKHFTVLNDQTYALNKIKFQKIAAIL